MPYRPQSVQLPTPPGFVDEDFIYYFDSNNTPGLAPLSSGQAVYKIVLQLQADAEFILSGFQVSGNTGPLCVRFYDPFGNDLGACQVECDRAFSGTENGAAPVGRLPVEVEPRIQCPAGGFLMIDVLVL